MRDVFGIVVAAIVSLPLAIFAVLFPFWLHCLLLGEGFLRFG